MAFLGHGRQVATLNRQRGVKRWLPCINCEHFIRVSLYTHYTKVKIVCVGLCVLTVPQIWYTLALHQRAGKRDTERERERERGSHYPSSEVHQLAPKLTEGCSQILVAGDGEQTPVKTLTRTTGAMQQQTDS